MTLDDAVKMLNKHGHRGFRDWFVSSGGSIVESSSNGSNLVDWLYPDEAIAVAEKLMRDAGRDLPATRDLIDAIKTKVAFHDRTGPEHMDGIHIGGRWICPETLRAIAAEWCGQPNPSTETDA